MKTDFNIRVSSPVDTEAISLVLNASYPQLMAQAYDDDLLKIVLPMMTQANQKLLNSKKYFVAHMTDDTIVGCGGWTHEAPGTGIVQEGVGHIRHFAVHPDWIGQGVGRAIFNSCRNQAKSEGMIEFECHSSLNGQKFYEAMGFHSEGLVDVRMNDLVNFPIIMMRLLLLSNDNGK